jgi:hypothetical protein
VASNRQKARALVPPAGEADAEAALVTSKPASDTVAVTPRVDGAVRRDALSRAAVWRLPRAEPLPDWSKATAAEPLECRFIVDVPGGTSAKFDCELADGRKLRVKYGSGPERHAEVAASALVSRLGFGTDRVLMVERLRCHGCPSNPFVTMKAVGFVRADALYARIVDYGKFVDFDWVSIEERFPGDAIESGEIEGWAWFELEEATKAARGARRAHLDAFRLLAVFLAHWDNKSENQRLVCLPGETGRDGRCRAPFALIQDLGATFGPRKVDLEAWRETPVWTDRATCQVSMQDLPHGGATFRTGHISESGRRFLADRLARLSDKDVEAIFTAARFQDYSRLFAPRATVPEWVATFRHRVRQVSEGPPCSTPRTPRG